MEAQFLIWIMLMRLYINILIRIMLNKKVIQTPHDIIGFGGRLVSLKYYGAFRLRETIKNLGILRDFGGGFISC